MPEYIPTEEEYDAYLYCVRNSIRISPGGTNIHNEWTIDIFAKGKWNKPPKSYGPKEVWEVFYNYCIYYYEKGKTEKI